ncbi:hypothetical protein HLH33_17180 [Gluconacetobacter diazotrophicus]|uniref:Uncharacterized protein n=1 Tax=Gluconacetobacter diazotrophicus TaxID=33996 RepID=A0A7W4NHT6_GLUDI|nr:hypothetical protein [Gluconacetobacter diazotrophicus]MBB2158007.1 hypothetical protein [Gluconacetobacter diazotrophicus]
MADNQTTGRKSRLKVFGGNLDGRNRVIMAVSSQKAFMAATGVPRSYLAETWNDDELLAAKSAPGTVFVQPIDAIKGTPWQEYQRDV